MTTMTNVLTNGNTYINDAAHDLDIMICEANGNYELANGFLREARNARTVELAIEYATKAQAIQYHLNCIMNWQAELPYGARMSWIKDAYYSITGDFDFSEAYRLLSWYENND